MSCDKALKKLSQHIKCIHPEIGDEERLKLCNAAKVAPGRGARKFERHKNEASLTDFFMLEDETGDELGLGL